MMNAAGRALTGFFVNRDAVFALVLAVTMVHASSQVETPEERPPVGKLPSTVEPLHYSLALTILPEQERFSGRAEISVLLSETADRIWLHGKDLDVTSAQVIDAAGNATPAKYDEVTPEGVASLTAEQPLPEGQLTLLLSYTAPFSPDIGGLFTVSEAGQQYAFSQFEPTHARKVFPGFDEPRFKTPFDITVTARVDHTVITNTLEVSSLPASDGLTRRTFATSPPLSTYLVTFAVGALDVVPWDPLPPSDVRDRPVPLRGIAAKGKGSQLTYALENTAGLFAPLEEYFNIAYPYAKLDLVAAPIYAGAMENAAAPLYGEQYLLVRDDASVAQKQGYAYTHAHELAHQWIGNLVTPEWWNDLWLKESFATFMGNRAAAMWQPQGNFDGAVLRMGLNAMELDSRSTARAIQQPVPTAADIGDAYSLLTYEKGNAVLGMLEGFAGEDIFRRSVQLYLSRFSDGTATTADFLQTLAEAAGAPYAADALASFLQQPGVPLLMVDWRCNGSELTADLKQSRYVPLGSTVSPNQQWHLPVCLAYDEGAERQKHCVLMAAPQHTVSLGVSACPVAVMPNAHGTGYYRFTLPADQRLALIEEFRKLQSGEALALAHSLAADMKAGRMSAEEYLKAAQEIASHPAVDVATTPIPTLMLLIRHLVAPDQRDIALEFMRDLYEPLLESAGLMDGTRSSALSSADTALLHERVVPFLSLEVRDQALRDRLAAMGSAYVGFGTSGTIDADAIDASLITSALAVAAQELGKPFIEHLWMRLMKSTDFVFRRNAVTGLANVTDPALADWVRGLLLSPELRDNEALELFVEQAGVAQNLEASWSWSKEHLLELSQRVPAFRRGRLPTIAADFCTTARRREAEAILTPIVHEFSRGAHSLQDTLEQIELCTALVERQRDSARQFFGTEHSAASALAEAALAEFDAPGQPGCALGIYQKGALVHAAGYGLADIDAQAPIGPDTVFNIASLSKQITAFAIFLLESRGQLSLDDSVRKYVPELGHFADEVTLRHLIHHTGGLRDYKVVLAMKGRTHEDHVTMKDVLRIIARQEAPNQRPGEIFEYSNTGYSLLALVVERVTGQDLNAFSATNIFGPLGMTSTSIVTEYPTNIAKLARGYAPLGNSFAIDESNWAGVGSGQVHSTILDLHRWDQNFYSGAVGGEAVIRRMRELGTLKSGGRMSYAGGLVLGTHRGLPTEAHNGSWAGYRSELLRFPDQRFAIALLCNRADARTGPRAESISAAYLGEAMEPETIPAFALTLAGYPGVTDPNELPEGYYRDNDRGRYVRFWRECGYPKLMTSGVEFDLVQHSDGLFASGSLRGLYLVFVQPEQGSPPRILLSSLGDEPVALEFLAQSYPRDLNRYVGRYRSPEAEVDYEIVLTKEGLVLKTLTDELPLYPGTDEFFNPDAGVALRFQPHSEPAKRFLFSVFQLRNLEFRRLE